MFVYNIHTIQYSIYTDLDWTQFNSLPLSQILKGSLFWGPSTNWTFWIPIFFGVSILIREVIINQNGFFYGQADRKKGGENFGPF